MNKKYWNYVDLPNWKAHQRDLINFRNSNPPPPEIIEEFVKMSADGQDPYVAWYCFFEDTIQEKLPILYNDFKKMGLDVRQLIFFDNKPNDENVKDPTDAMCPFIHIDSRDDEEEVNDDSLNVYNTNYKNERASFDPISALNIPLENCENSFTTFYEFIKEESQVYYPNFYHCGGVDPTTVVEVDRFTLDKPAILRVNVPHAVLNPTDKIRHVATFRFYQDLENFLTD